MSKVTDSLTFSNFWSKVRKIVSRRRRNSDLEGSSLPQIDNFFISTHLLLVGSFRSLNNWKLNAASFKVKRLNTHRLGNYDYGHTTQLNFGFKRPIWVLIGQFQAYPVLKISTIIKIEQQKKWEMNETHDRVSDFFHVGSFQTLTLKLAEFSFQLFSERKLPTRQNV